MKQEVENIVTWVLPGHKNPCLLVRKEGETDWAIIAVLRVTSEEFWKHLGYGLGVTFVSKE